MLRSLQLNDFVLVQTAEIDFPAGFTALTGETGAGKSILIDALALVLGARGDAGAVRQGAAKTSITASFDCSVAQAAWLREHELAGADDHSLLLRRVIDAMGKSKAFINGINVPLAQLRELGDSLVDIHGQHAHQLLLKPAAQRTLLDRFGGHDTATVAAAFQTYKQATDALQLAEQGSEKIQLERERLAWQRDELERLAPQADEWQEIEAEHQRLANAAALIQAAASAVTALTERDSGAVPILTELSSLQHRLSAVLVHDARLKDAVEALEAARIQASEAADQLSDYLQNSDLDPARLAQIENRLSTLHSTARKLRLAPEDLHTAWQETAVRLAALDAQTDLAVLRQAQTKALQSYQAAAKILSQARASSAKKLASQVSQAMQSLAMQGGQLQIVLQANPSPSPAGNESLDFQIAAHAGVAAKSLAKVASGGELSRISLAIAVIASTANATPTLIFDEVDSGVGGAVAEVLGQLMRRLGRDCQVLAVTHLPQVAAQAHAQFQVEKRTTAGVTTSRISPLSLPQRTDELARMLGGQVISATSRQHATEMLQNAAKDS